MLSSRQFSTFLEGKYRSSTYSLLSSVDLERQAILKLHFDKWRDVHIIATGIDEEINKEYGIEIKWDADRDPEIKFVVNVQLNKFISLNNGKNMSGVIRVLYPGRLVTGSCMFILKARNNYVMDTCLEWNTDRAIKFTVDTDYDVQNWIKILKLESQLLTPFKNWKKTSLNGK
jgi:hypothetical protein